jgi:hypothetical protein
LCCFGSERKSTQTLPDLQNNGSTGLATDHCIEMPQTNWKQSSTSSTNDINGESEVVFDNSSQDIGPQNNNGQIYSSMSNTGGNGSEVEGSGFTRSVAGVLAAGGGIPMISISGLLRGTGTGTVGGGGGGARDRPSGSTGSYAPLGVHMTGKEYVTTSATKNGSSMTASDEYSGGNTYPHGSDGREVA